MESLFKEVCKLQRCDLIMNGVKAEDTKKFGALDLDEWAKA